MLTIIFSKREQERINELSIEFLNYVFSSIKSINMKIDFGFIIEDGKIVGIEKEM